MIGNLHTHSTYCDGSNSLRSLTEAAIDKGFSYLGFSGHSFTPFDTSYCMSIENTEKYFNEAQSLKNKYKDKINIYCGIEKDFYAPPISQVHDFEIGSVHYIKKKNIYYPIDENAEQVQRNVDEAFGGDPYKYAEYYFQTVSNIPQKLIGHFDLITKFNDDMQLFSENDKRYKEAALSAIEKLIKRGCVFEVNTGAMARGVKKTPYPAVWILEKIRQHNGFVILTSDCHAAQHLDFAFEETESLLKNIGFINIYDIIPGILFS